MRRILLTIAYDGTNYVGWQIQPNGTAIEEVLNKHLSRLLNEEIVVIGASRTDSGVHALGNLAVFDTESRIPADKFKFALNQRLPGDIVIQESCEVPLDWHPRKINSTKTYEYRILNRKIPLPRERFDSYFYYYDLDVERMQKAAECMVGEHDYKSFCSIRTQVEDTVRRIYSLEVKKTGDIISIIISGNGFLYNMVRIIVGTLVKIGTGLWEPERMKEILEARDRSMAGPKAPAEGLTLVSIVEPKELPPKMEEENEHWAYRVIYQEIEKKGVGYLFIDRCDEEDYEHLLLRMVKQLSRNKAKKIYVCDRTGRLFLGKTADYFLFDQEMEIHLLQGMPKELLSTNDWGELPEVELISVDKTNVKEYIRIFQPAFFEMPFGVTYTKEDEARLCNEEKLEAFLLFYEGHAVGVMEWVFEDNSLHLEGVGVIPEFRGKHIGKAVMRRTLQEAILRNVESVKLTAATNNEPAYSWYLNVGFSVEKCVTHWYETRDRKQNE